MRNRFNLPPVMGSYPISKITIHTKTRDKISHILLALEDIVVYQEYNQT